jgi:hypothetical protein
MHVPTNGVRDFQIRRKKRRKTAFSTASCWLDLPDRRANEQFEDFHTMRAQVFSPKAPNIAKHSVYLREILSDRRNAFCELIS